MSVDSFVPAKKFDLMVKRVKLLEAKSKKQEDKIGQLTRELNKIKLAINFQGDHQGDDIDVEVICDMPDTPAVNLDDIVRQHLTRFQFGGENANRSSKSPSKNAKNQQPNWAHGGATVKIEKEEIYNCTICSKSFTRPYNLELHKRQHTGERPFKCEFCERTFSNSSNMKTHTRTHTGEKPYACTFCNLSFSRSISLKKHSKVHTGESSTTAAASCSICPENFSDRRLLNKHIIAAHQDGGKLAKKSQNVNKSQQNNFGLPGFGQQEQQIQIPAVVRGVGSQNQNKNLFPTNPTDFQFQLQNNAYTSPYFGRY